MQKFHLLNRPASLNDIGDLDDQVDNWQIKADALQERRWRKIRRMTAALS